jgi:hydrogenase maturation protein HypF
VVQGVGFRPFVHRLALRHGLSGRVRNEGGEVSARVEGETASLEAFVDGLRAEAPPLARIDGLEAVPAEPGGLAGFRVVPSEDRGGRQPVSPDVSTCPACEAELLDPTDRRHRYPFVTCTDCGPRYTVIRSMPYDRERTSMAAFRQCPACEAEYRTPAHRRYHSETNACPACGPSVRLEGTGADGRVAAAARGDDAVRRAAGTLAAGGIVAVRGVGGFHLAVDATDEAAVRRLRERKGREAKPLAVMVRTLEEARRLGRVDDVEAELLVSRRRPIVLLGARSDAGLAPSVAPGVGTVGVMLAYAPLHHLLLAEVGRPLVMTSGNVTDEPLAAGNGEARERLGGIADALLLHDREIVARLDDSVARVADGTPVLLRRARGWAPLPVDLPVATPLPLLAVGPHLKNTFTLAEGGRAYTSPHIGDLDGVEVLDHFRATLDHYRELYRVEPAVAVRDLHPAYLSTRVAEESGLGRILAVQHHHAHVAAVAAENGVAGPVVGLAFDGTGHGDDGRVWGAEALVADLRGYARVGRLRYARLPGGELAVRRPWRSALGILSLEPLGDVDAADVATARGMALEGVPDREARTAEQQLLRAVNAPEASSMGRLFDAAAAVLGLRGVAQFEAQAAMEVEALAADRPGHPLPFPLREGEDGWVMDPLPLLAALGRGRAEGVEPSRLAAGFHEAAARTAAELARRAVEAHGPGRVALSGGVFQNARLLSSVRRRLAASGLEVLLPRELGPGDGAISYGQAAVAAALLQDEEA